MWVYWRFHHIACSRNIREDESNISCPVLRQEVAGDVRVALDASVESPPDPVLHRTVSFDKRYLEQEDVYAFDNIAQKGKDPYFGHQSSTYLQWSAEAVCRTQSW